MNIIIHVDNTTYIAPANESFPVTAEYLNIDVFIEPKMFDDTEDARRFLNEEKGFDQQMMDDVVLLPRMTEVAGG